jgi:hypothetical protein
MNDQNVFDDYQKGILAFLCATVVLAFGVFYCVGPMLLLQFKLIVAILGASGLIGFGVYAWYSFDEDYWLMSALSFTFAAMIFSLHFLMIAYIPVFEDGSFWGSKFPGESNLVLWWVQILIAIGTGAAAFGLTCFFHWISCQLNPVRFSRSTC